MSYTIKTSPFYKLSSKRHLCELLEINYSLKTLRSLCLDSKYFARSKKKKTKFGQDKLRPIEEPKPDLKKIHSRLKDLFARIEAPPYLKSGVKGESYKTNAEAHLVQKAKYYVMMDIKAFFPSCTQNSLFKSLKDHFEMMPDIAWTLSNLVTYKGHVPTGSPFSQQAAFWANKSIFDEIGKLAQKYSIAFTLYVDDMTFSSQKRIPQAFLNGVNKLLNSNDLRIKASKTEFCGPNDFKCVTGAGITPSGNLAVPNKRKKTIISCAKKPDLTLKDLSSLVGRINEVQFLEETIFGNSIKNQALSLAKEARKNKVERTTKPIR